MRHQKQHQRKATSKATARALKKLADANRPGKTETTTKRARATKNGVSGDRTRGRSPVQHPVGPSDRLSDVVVSMANDQQDSMNVDQLLLNRACNETVHESLCEVKALFSPFMNKKSEATGETWSKDKIVGHMSKELQYSFTGDIVRLTNDLQNVRLRSANSGQLLGDTHRVALRRMIEEINKRKHQAEAPVDTIDWLSSRDTLAGGKISNASLAGDTNKSEVKHLLGLCCMVAKEIYQTMGLDATEKPYIFFADCMSGERSIIAIGVGSPRERLKFGQEINSSDLAVLFQLARKASDKKGQQEWAKSQCRRLWHGNSSAWHKGYLQNMGLKKVPKWLSAELSDCERKSTSVPTATEIETWLGGRDVGTDTSSGVFVELPGGQFHHTDGKPDGDIFLPPHGPVQDKTALPGLLFIFNIGDEDVRATELPLCDGKSGKVPFFVARRGPQPFPQNLPLQNDAKLISRRIHKGEMFVTFLGIVHTAAKGDVPQFQNFCWSLETQSQWDCY